MYVQVNVQASLLFLQQHGQHWEEHVVSSMLLVKAEDPFYSRPLFVPKQHFKSESITVYSTWFGKRCVLYAWYTFYHRGFVFRAEYQMTEVRSSTLYQGEYGRNAYLVQPTCPFTPCIFNAAWNNEFFVNISAFSRETSCISIYTFRNN